ncbi:MAG: hypothetical protein ACYC7E_14825 [Armatimonadota bacterium]
MNAGELLTYLLGAVVIVCGWWWLTGSFPWKKHPSVGEFSFRDGEWDAVPASQALVRTAPGDEQMRQVREEMRTMKRMLAEILARLDDEPRELPVQPVPSFAIAEESVDIPSSESRDLELSEQDPAEDVYALAERGISSREIAKQTGLSRGEVDLLLRLRAVAVAVGE